MTKHAINIKEKEAVTQSFLDLKLWPLWLDLVTSKIPAASKEDSCPQAILKSHPCSSLDYRAHQRLPIIKETWLFSAISLHSLKRSIWNK